MINVYNVILKGKIRLIKIKKKRRKKKKKKEIIAHLILF